MIENSSNNGHKYTDLLEESSRQLTICNSCRYCEGFCPVWDIIEYRRVFEKGSVEYIANLCHDCGQCFDVCPYAPPHELAVDIPTILGEVRSYTYREYASPKIAFRLFSKQSFLLTITIIFSFLVILALYLSTGDPRRLFNLVIGAKSFYLILPNIAIDTAGILLGLFFIIAWVVSGWKFLKATDKSEKVKISDFVNALFESYSGKWLKGGRAGCNYPERKKSGSYLKVTMHSFILVGFTLDLLATVSAFIEENFFRIFPPYPILSVPVISGLVGGILIIGGVVLFFSLDSVDNGYKSDNMKDMDKIFLIDLLIVSVTGIILFTMRNTNLMGSLLLVHLSFVGTLFITAPYSKFVHLVYRILSVSKYHQEKRAFENKNL